MEFSKDPDNYSHEKMTYINDKLRYYNKLVQDFSDKAIKYLFIVNAGGTVAVLSFIGTSSNVDQISALKITLYFFSIGLILSIILYSYIYLRWQWLFLKFDEDAQEYINQKMDWTDLMSNEKKRMRGKSVWISFILGFFSLGCFIIGALFSIFQFK